MKKKLFLTAGLLCLSTLTFANTAPVKTTMAPPPPPPYHTIDSLTKFSYDDCMTQIVIHLHSTVAFNGLVTVQVDTWPFDGITQSVYLTPLQEGLQMPADTTFKGIPVSPSVPSVYYITVHDLDNSTSVAAQPIFANAKRCYYDKFHFFNTPNPSDAVDDAMFVPEDPNEDPDLEVQWKIEGIDQNMTPSFSVYNTICWNDVNSGGKSCTFKGFDGSSAAASIADLQAGNCSSDDGTFDMTQHYLITRSYRMPGDDWESYSMFIGPGTNEPEAPEDKSLSVKTPAAADLFQLAQDRTAKTVTFQTDLHAGRFEIVDAAGRHMRSIELSQEAAAYTLDVAAFAKGLYVVRLVSGSQASTEKFVVE